MLPRPCNGRLLPLLPLVATIAALLAGCSVTTQPPEPSWWTDPWPYFLGSALALLAGVVLRFIERQRLRNRPGRLEKQAPSSDRQLDNQKQSEQPDRARLNEPQKPLNSSDAAPKSACTKLDRPVIPSLEPPPVAEEPANEGDSIDEKTNGAEGGASADSAVSAGNRQVRINIFAPRTGQAAQEQLVVVQRIIEETDPSTHSGHKAPLSKQPGPFEKAAADSTGDQVWNPIEKCWWITPQDYQVLADCAGWVKGVNTSWHDLVLVEPAQRVALGAGFPSASADVIGLIAGKVALPGDNAFKDARRLFLCTGIMFGVVSGAAPIANACFSSLAHDLLVEATAKAFRAAIDQALPPTSDTRVQQSRDEKVSHDAQAPQFNSYPFAAGQSRDHLEESGRYPHEDQNSEVDDKYDVDGA